MRAQPRGSRCVHADAVHGFYFSYRLRLAEDSVQACVTCAESHTCHRLMQTCAQARPSLGRRAGAAATDPCHVIRTENALHHEINWGQRAGICGDSPNRTVSPKLMGPFKRNIYLHSKNCSRVGARPTHSDRSGLVCICMEVRRPEQQACTVHARWRGRHGEIAAVVVSP